MSVEIICDKCKHTIMPMCNCYCAVCITHEQMEILELKEQVKSLEKEIKGLKDSKHET